MAKSAVPSSVDYAVEKAAAHARQQTAWAAAEAEFTAWYQDLGTRAERHTDGHAGVHRNRILTTTPKCFCGKATVALGLCQNHYSVFWDRRTGKFKGLRNRTALCHPDRPHHAYGLCMPCYNRLPQVRAAIKLNKLKRAVLGAKIVKVKKKAWLCRHTNRQHLSRGLCKSCYQMAWKKGALPPRLPAIRHNPAKPLCMHKDRPVRARGLCSTCHSIWYKRQKNPAPSKTFRQPGMPLKCGHDAPHYGNDLCERCFNAWRYRRRDKNRKRQPLVFDVVWPRVPRIPICGHPDKLHHAKGCCANCYKRGVYKTPEFAKMLVEQTIA